VEQLPLFPLNHQVVIPVVPPPIPVKDGFFAGSWEWPYNKNSACLTRDPSQLTQLINACPLETGTFYGDGPLIIDRVRVVQTKALGWVWLVELREPGDDDFEPFWDYYRQLLSPSPRIRCEVCLSTKGVTLVGAMTAYEATKDNPDPNRSLNLCEECATEYREHWTEMWNNYYGNLL
jgi:hypothetical protein